ncbi:hypothetical protein LGQ02_08335 [Bacillus shivajii]|uniref:hypothetical protein n=1 Tax=Bacillus shivajii TaxID=1983719 RepID=UPI001CFB516E|nr:hypothetical protein [Bacillus shivajii]UCZ54738.1 hypothetical protein LGQ02_08335 [Bacillus shivajii]
MVKKSSRFEHQTSEPIKEQSESNHIDNESIDALNLPSRKDVHQSRVSKKENRHRKNKKKRVNYPLVRVLVVLFFLIVTFVLTYPFWADKIIF